MIARWIACLLAGLGLSFAAPAFAQVDKDVVMVTGLRVQKLEEDVDASRVAGPGGGGPPYVSLAVPADFVIFTLTLETGTHAIDARRKELEGSFKAVSDKVGKAKGVVLEVGLPGDSSAVETTAAKEVIENDGDRSRISLVLKFAAQKGDTFGAIRTRAEKFIADIPVTGRVEAVAGDEQYIGVTEPRKHREALLRKIADDAKLLQTIFAGGSGQSPGFSLTGLEGRVKYRPSGPLELEMYIPYNIVLGPPPPLPPR